MSKFLSLIFNTSFEYMNYLRKLVSIKSDENGDEIINYLFEYFQGKVEDIKIIKNQENEHKSILIGFNTKLKNCSPIVLSGHLDTVIPNYELYNTDPFILTEIDGKNYGLGSIDMKSFMAIIMENVEQLKEKTEPIIGCFTTDEETEFICIRNVVEEMKKLNIYPKFTIVGEPTSSHIHIVSKGFLCCQIKFYGKACHSSIPQNGINSIYALAKFVSFIEENQKKYTDLTSNAGVVSGGEIVNKVPDYAVLTIDIRSNYKDEIDRFFSEIENKAIQIEHEYNGIKIVIEKFLFIPPLQNQNNEKINEIAKCLNIEIGEFSGGCEGGYYTKYSGDAVIFGVGDLSLAHKPNEYVKNEDFDRYPSLLFELIEKINYYYK